MTLTICPTPIGNLSDVTPRQREALATADVIACEDTRTTGKLLELLGISREQGKPRLLSYHEHNEQERVEKLLGELKRGQKVVLVSDAGTPGISDPGYRLVQAASQEDIEVSALPGPVAAMVALSACGLPSAHFYFEGFLPSKEKARQQRLQTLNLLDATLIFYESPHRLIDLLCDIVVVCGESRAVCVARELTKRYEEYVRGNAHEVLQTFENRERIKGEYVVIVGPPTSTGTEDSQDEQIERKIRELLEQGMNPRGIKEVVSELYAIPKSQIYPRIEAIKKTF